MSDPIKSASWLRVSSDHQDASNQIASIDKIFWETKKG